MPEVSSDVLNESLGRLAARDETPLKTPLNGLSSRSRPMVMVESRAPPCAAVLSSNETLTETLEPEVNVRSETRLLIWMLSQRLAPLTDRVTVSRCAPADLSPAGWRVPPARRDMCQPI